MCSIGFLIMILTILDRILLGRMTLLIYVYKRNTLIPLVLRDEAHLVDLLLVILHLYLP